jgi:ribose transport system permease protein
MTEQLEHERAQVADAGAAVTSITGRRGTTGRLSPKVLSVLERYGLVWMLVVLVAFFAIWPETSSTFTSTANIRNLVAGQAVLAIAALALLIPLVAGQFDVSVGSVAVGTSIAVAALAGDAGVPLGVALAGGIVLAALVGLINGLIVAYIRADAIVISLGTATLVSGLGALYTKNESIVTVPQPLVEFGGGLWLGVPRPVWLMLVVICAVGYLMRYTVTGRQLLMLGSNPDASKLVGVRTQRLLLTSFILGAILYGVAGALLLARTGAANPGDGFGTTLGALTAVFLGVTTIRPGRFNVPGTIVGVYFVAVSVNGLTLAGAAAWVNPVFTGATLVIAVSISALLSRRRAA